MKQKRLWVTLSALGTLVLGTGGVSSTIAAASLGHQDFVTPELTRAVTINSAKETKEIFNRIYIGKNSGIPIAGNAADKQIIAKITDTSGKLITNITSVDGQNYVDVKLPLGDYYVEIVKGLDNPTYLNDKVGKRVLLSPKTGIEPYDAPEKYPNANLLYQPIILKDDHDPKHLYHLNDVVVNHTIEDVLGYKFKFNNNMYTNKLTFLIFMDTQDNYSMKMLTSLDKLLTSRKWKDKVNVFCITSTTPKDELIKLQSSTFSQFRWVEDNDRSFQRHFFYPNQTLPGIALVDFQGCVDALEYGDKDAHWFEAMIRKYSLPEFLDFEFNADYKTDYGDGKDKLPESGLPKTLSELIKIQSSEIAKAEKYNSADYSIIDETYTAVKPDEYVNEAVNITSYISLLRNWGIFQNFSRDAIERNLFYRSLKNDYLLLNTLDIWKKTGNRKQELSDAINLYSSWLGPIDVSDYSTDKYALAKNVQIAGYSLKNFFSYASLDARNAAIKQLIARYGAIAVTFKDTKITDYTNSNSKNDKGNSYSTILYGWDDSIETFKYTPEATKKGGFICKNTSESIPGHEKFYLSYDSPLWDAVSFDLRPLNYLDFNNNYYYDANPLSSPINPTVASNQAAAIFPAQLANYYIREEVSAVSVAVAGDDVTIDVSVFKNVDNVDFANPGKALDPTQGELLVTAKGYAKYSGDVLVYLPFPVEIERGENFSIVVNVSNPKNDARIVYGVDRSVDNMTYYNHHGKWTNAMASQEHAAARIKAFTQTYTIFEDEISNDLEYSDILLSKYSYRYQSDEFLPVPTVFFNGQVLSNTQYEVIYKKEVLQPEATFKDSDTIIGRGEIVVKGKEPLIGERRAIYWVSVGSAPKLGNIGSYGNYVNNAPQNITLKINQSARRIRDIILPYGFKWKNVDLEAEISVVNISQGSLVYTEEDANCFLINEWPGNRISFSRLNSDSIVPPEKPTDPKPDPNPQPEPNRPLPPGPTPQPPYPNPDIPYFPTSHKSGPSLTEIIALAVIILVALVVIALVIVVIHIKKNRRY